MTDATAHTTEQKPPQDKPQTPPLRHIRDMTREERAKAISDYENRQPRRR